MYKPPPTAATNQSGAVFDVPEKFLTYPDSFIKTKSEFDAILHQFIFLTGCSSNHFKESVDAVAGVQSRFPGKHIIYYDLGLTEPQVKEIKTWCNVTYRKLDFSKYPPHVKNLHTYAFKPVIVHEVIMEYPGIFWIDASVRHVDLSKSYDTVYALVTANGGISEFDYTSRMVFGVTQGGMYKFLTSNYEKLKDNEQYGANAIMMYRTEFVYWNVIHWWYLCALVEECITPPGHRLGCGAPQRDKSVCHRYDQSAISILLANTYNYDTAKYSVKREVVGMVITRGPTSRYKIKKCA